MIRPRTGDFAGDGCSSTGKGSAGVAAATGRARSVVVSGARRLGNRLQRLHDAPLEHEHCAGLQLDVCCSGGGNASRDLSGRRVGGRSRLERDRCHHPRRDRADPGTKRPSGTRSRSQIIRRSAAVTRRSAPRATLPEGVGLGPPNPLRPMPRPMAVRQLRAPLQCAPIDGRGAEPWKSFSSTSVPPAPHYSVT